MALASWWNPFSWNWNIFDIFKKPQAEIKISQDNMMIIEDNSKIPENNERKDEKKDQGNPLLEETFKAPENDKSLDSVDKKVIDTKPLLEETIENSLKK